VIGSRRAFAGTLLLVVLALAPAACSDGDDDGAAAVGSSTTSTTRRSTATSSTTDASGSTGTSQPTGSVEEEITARYLAFWEARFAANQDPPNPDDPQLAEYATGQQLANVIDETARRRDEGLALRRPQNSVGEHDVRVSSVDGDVARLQDCTVNDGIIYRVATGEVVNDDVVTQSVSATMRRVDGEWRLERATLVQEWPGVAGCALAAD